MPHQLRRLGPASAAVSAGTLVLLLSAPPADAASPAGTASAGRPCTPGTDPASTIENWKCNLGNLRDIILPGPREPKPAPAPKPKPRPKPAPKPSRGKGPTEPGKEPGPTPGKHGGGRGAPAAPPVGGAGAAPSTMTGAGGPLPYRAPATPETPAVPGLLAPAPQVAADPGGYAAAVPRTRLISPAAATGRDGGQTLWITGAAGAAGAAALLNLGVTGRTRRRPHR